MYFEKIVLLLVSCAAITEMKPLKSIAEDMSIIMKCNETSPISKRTLNMALIEKSIERPVNKNLKCFLHCLYKNYDWMENNGEFRHDTMKSGLTESTLVDRAIDYLINTCTKIKNTDKCERAFEFTQCFWTENTRVEEFTSAEWQWMNT